MLKRSIIVLVVVCISYMALMLIWASADFPTINQICSEASHNAQPDSSTDYCPVVISWHILHWVGKHTNTLTVFGTFILAGIVLVQLIDARRSNERQLRAYVSVSFLGLVPQDRAVNYFFEPRVVLINTGNTPAYDMYQRSAADILPVPLPANFTFPLPAEDAGASSGILGPKQNFIISAALNRLLSDEEITEVSTTTNRNIYIWGTIKYRDAFGVDRFTNFSQRVVWLKGGQFMSFNTRRHNDAN